MKTCEQRINDHMTSRTKDLRLLWAAYCDGVEEVEDLGNIFDYGLSFDYVPEEEDHGYFRYQISWGGPSEEYRFYVDYDHKPYKIEFVFMDWFDGATRRLYGKDLVLLTDLFEWFNDCGVVEAEYNKAV